MSGEAVLERRDRGRQQALAEALRAQWRIFDRVSLAPGPAGEGFRATIYLDATIVRAAAEQQGSNRSPALASRAEERRGRAIAECVDSFNAGRSRAERILEFQVLL